MNEGKEAASCEKMRNDTVKEDERRDRARESEGDRLKRKGSN